MRKSKEPCENYPKAIIYQDRCYIKAGQKNISFQTVGFGPEDPVYGKFIINLENGQGMSKGACVDFNKLFELCLELVDSEVDKRLNLGLETPPKSRSKRKFKVKRR